MGLTSARLRRFLSHLLLPPGKFLAIVAAYGYLSHVLRSWWDAGMGGEIAGTLALGLALWAVFTLYTRWLERRPVTEFAARGAAREGLAGLVIGILLMTAIIAVLALLGAYHVDGVGDAHRLIAPFLDALTTGLFEETLFRGVIFAIAEHWLGSYWAVLVSAALFGAAHLFNPHAGLFAATQIALEAGLLLAAAYLLTRHLWLAIGIHVGWNFAEGGIFGATESGTSASGLLHSSTSGPDWLSGGAFGPEASPIAALLGVALAVLLLLRARRLDHIRPPPWLRPQKSATVATP
jgi:membrane protease YdiL (CAAX protease family)